MPEEKFRSRSEVKRERVEQCDGVELALSLHQRARPIRGMKTLIESAQLRLNLRVSKSHFPPGSSLGLFRRYLLTGRLCHVQTRTSARRRKVELQFGDQTHKLRSGHSHNRLAAPTLTRICRRVHRGNRRQSVRDTPVADSCGRSKLRNDREPWLFFGWG